MINKETGIQTDTANKQVERRTDSKIERNNIYLIQEDAIWDKYVQKPLRNILCFTKFVELQAKKRKTATP